MFFYLFHLLFAKVAVHTAHQRTKAIQFVPHFVKRWSHKTFARQAELDKCTLVIGSDLFTYKSK